MSDLEHEQRKLCEKYGALFLSADPWRMVGISKNFNALQFPINGLRHPPETGREAGWYIWSGTELSQDDDFFVPMHVMHVDDKCPQIVKYLGLAPGWRFLVAPGYEDVWYDEKLFDI
jgi:hypothetical protein